MGNGALRGLSASLPLPSPSPSSSSLLVQKETVTKLLEVVRATSLEQSLQNSALEQLALIIQGEWCVCVCVSVCVCVRACMCVP